MKFISALDYDTVSEDEDTMSEHEDEFILLLGNEKETKDRLPL
jgi:hypothetical protein